MQVSSSGGGAVKAAAPFSCFSICDISPDKTELLGRQGGPDGPLWVLSLANGLARRLDSLNGHAATWSPRGEKIVYASGGTTDNDVYVVAADAGQPRKLAHFEGGYVWTIRWSPDEKTLRMTVQFRGVESSGSYSLWQVSEDGTNLHKLAVFPGDSHSITDGNWTSDGRYFVFTVARDPNFAMAYAREGTIGSDIWALRERKSFFDKGVSPPIQLTLGPTGFWSPVPSPDNKHIFAIGGQFRGELVRFDLHSRTLEPFLSGISADQLGFSRNGKWVAYITYPEGVLWRSRVDGTDRLQLTTLPFRADLPCWSPDGSRIAFSGLLPGETWKIYVVSADGGKPEVVSQSQEDELDPTWSAGGDSLVFGRRLQSAHPQISSVDLRTGRVTMIPGSEGLFSPRVSPNGRFIVAVDAPGSRKLFLFDQKTQKWSELLARQNPSIGWQAWTLDSKSAYAFVFGTESTDEHSLNLYRIRIADRNIERVAVFQVPEGITGTWFGWAGVTPDGSPLVLRDLSIWEIYALDVDLP